MNIECTADELQRLVGRGAKPRTRTTNAPMNVNNMPLMKWTASVYHQVMNKIGLMPPERGAILLGPSQDKIATHFVFDETGEGTFTSWTYGHQRINEILKQYVPLNLHMLAFVHSHPPRSTSLSSQDLTDFRKPFANPKNEELTELWAPLLVEGRVYPYILYRDDPTPVLAQLVLC